MSPIIHLHDQPDRFVAGTVGQPGERTFYLQARSQRRVTSVRLEKEQVQVLAERVIAILDGLSAADAGESDSSFVLSSEDLDDAPLETPIVEDFSVGTMTLSWDADTAKVVFEVFGRDDEPAEMLVVKLSQAAARAFARRSDLVVSGGRPTCVFCGHPIDADGHLCVRSNGFRRRNS